MSQFLQKHKQYLLSGVSFAIPFIACGGILIAVSIAAVPIGENGPDWAAGKPIWKQVNDIGGMAFALMLPVLAGYIANAMAGKPGLVAGFIGGYMAGMPHPVEGVDTQVAAGFLGALLAGLLAGHIVMLLKKIPTHKFIKPIMPILIIPIVSSLAIGAIMYGVSLPLAKIMVSLNNWLVSMQSGSAVLLAMVLGAMVAFDMGGPVNKAAFFFGASMLTQGNSHIMGTLAPAICIPPIGMGLATFLKRSNWTEDQRESGIAAFGMGFMGITEGAIPFAAADPIRVIPCIMLGSMVGAVISVLGRVQDAAPHGGLIVLPVISNKVMFIIAVIVGVLVTAISVNVLKMFGNKK